VKKKGIPGYFTVEASLIMPIVLGGYLLAGALLCFMYERCILEQNTCRLLVWEAYEEGYQSIYPKEAQQMSKEQMWEDLLNQMNAEERHRYVLGQQVQTKVLAKREKVTIDRSFVYTPFGKEEYQIIMTGGCPDPVDYIRGTKLLGYIFTESKENKNED